MRQPIKFVVDNADTVINMLVTDTGKVIVGVGLIAPEKRYQKINAQAFDVTDCFTGPALNELSPAVTEIQLWNWKANIDGAKYKFYTLIKERTTDKFLNQHPASVTEEMRLKCAFQKYNYYGWDNEKKREHYYYKWDRKGWVPDEKVPISKFRGEKYADGVYNIYSNLNKKRQ